MTIASLGDPALHFWMTRSVARAMGVSLSEAMAAGRLSSDGYAKMVTRCRTCQQVQNCQIWLANQAGFATTAPNDCLNADAYDKARGDVAFA